MSALDSIHRALTEAYGTGVVLGDETAEDLLKAVVAEAEMDAQAYPGELAMLRGLIATLTAVAEHGDLTQVRKLLEEHQADDAQARAEAKPDAPNFFQPGHTYHRFVGDRELYFRVVLVSTDNPNKPESLAGDGLVAFGWMRTERQTTFWDPAGKTSLAGWRDITHLTTGEDGQP